MPDLPEAMCDRALAAEAEVERWQCIRAEVARLTAERDALVKALERLVLAGRHINITPPRDDDANRQSDHDEFYAANRAGEDAVRTLLDRLAKEGA